MSTEEDNSMRFTGPPIRWSYVIGNGNLNFNMTSKPPNWFHALMVRLILGWKVERVK